MKSFYNIIEYVSGALFNIVFIVIGVVAVYFVSSNAYAYGMDMFNKDMDVALETYEIVIPESGEEENRADALHVGRILEEAGLTKNAWVFFLEARLNGLYKDFRPGTYQFTTHMGNGEIMEIMQTAQFADAAETQISIPEGLNLRQIAELCERKELFTAQEFLDACEEYERMFFFLEPVQWRKNPLEGYLFPDTYRLPENPQPIDLIDRMLQRFQDVFNYELEDRAQELGFTIDEVVIMASIIEKEINRADERALCSSIIHNRLKKNMPLQMCSTVLFVLDVPISRLSLSDLEVESPYNTYRNAGLPIGPICSPGKAAIMAALNPADTNYLYMVVKDEDTGVHEFNSDYNNHLDAKDRYNQQF